MKTINEQASNVVDIVGKVVSVSTRSGKTSAGKPYESVNLIVRVEENIEGQKGISEIPISFFASQYTNTGKINPVYETVQKLKGLKTIETFGVNGAESVHISRANLQENYYVAKSGQLVDGWQLRGSFCNSVKDTAPQAAKFNVDLFILGMRDEETKEGDLTGRMIVKGAIVQYGGNLDVIEFIVEDPEKVNYLQRNWEENQTVHVCGRIRYTVSEVQKPVETSSWGETMSETSSRTIRELIITGGNDNPFEEDMAYDPVEIKKAFNVRKAKMEQKQVEAKNTAPKTTETPTKFDWE